MLKTTMETLIILPVLGRPHRVQPVLESVETGTPEPHKTVFVVTRGDTAVTSAIVEAGADWIVIRPISRGDYASKINLAYELSDQPYLFTGADDLNFHPGWLTHALAKMTEGIGVVGTNDLGHPGTKRGTHSTHSLISRAYADEYGTIDQPHKIYHEGYWHEYVDNELVATALKRKAYAHARDSIVEHLHPFFGKAPQDPLYKQFHTRMVQGRTLYQERRKLWE